MLSAYVGYLGVLICWSSNHAFVHGNVKDIFGKEKDSTLNGVMTVYVFHDVDSDYVVQAYSFNILSTEAKESTWVDQAVIAFGDGKLFDKGEWQSLFTKIDNKAFMNAAEQSRLKWEETGNDRSIDLAPGAVVKIKPVHRGTALLYISAVPHTAVKFDDEGKCLPTLENGMNYDELRVVL
ncbi:hypothetical protein DSL72_002409 [Monilinia vaccinii-corymbosi]|uniref:Uncharacterized protein n=1 Tax=Monilinia vaccinii-corymbosi TaxID=61207 RepID=A0A8A3PCL6_9HELO|nr:hypothetical protein DSL72_002409 [Monilinia vaccinii-corymbosi]